MGRWGLLDSDYADMLLNLKRSEALNALSALMVGLYKVCCLHAQTTNTTNTTHYLDTYGDGKGVY